MIEAVTFDFWNTLMWEGPGQLVGGRMQAWAGILEEAGAPIKREMLEAAHQVAFEGYQRAWRANEQYVVRDATQAMVAHLGLDVPDKVREALVESFAIAGEATAIHPAEGVEPCIHDLRGAGLRLWIICDVGLTPSPALRQHLERHDLLELFDGWSFSDEVGYYKPAPQIFHHALAGLGSEAPAAVAHVGDRLRTDVAGAAAVGMTSVRYTGVYDDPEEGYPEADIVVASLAELPTLLLEPTLA